MESTREQNTSKILEGWCNTAPRNISHNCAGCSEQPVPDWNQWPKEIDAITKRPRTPNDPYTKLTDEMVKNLRKESGPHFRLLDHSDKNVHPLGYSRHFRERHADIISKHLVRSQPPSLDLGIITDDKFHKFAQEPYTTCGQEAFEKWPGQMAGQLWLGDATQQKGGLATKSHQFGEVQERFTTIDMYRRPNTNCPGECRMKFSRPGLGYYLQRYPTNEPYFGSEMPLNQRDVLQDIQPKTLDEYKQRDAFIRHNYATRDEKWPFISEYSDRFARKTSVEHISRNPRDKKMVQEFIRARDECDFLEAK